MIKITLIILCFITLISCKNYYRTEERGIRPKNSDFQLSKEPYILKENSLIDTNAVYIHKRKVFYNDAPEIEEYFYRFFANRRCMRGFPEDFKRSLLVRSDFSNPMRGDVFVGYFKIQNSEKLISETFSVGVGENGKYYMDFGLISGDSIFITNFEVKYRKSLDVNDAKIYIKRKVSGLSSAPDW